ncbi:MAG: hypothetical protein U0531_08890 [Dehalococcoidia bacterium]
MYALDTWLETLDRRRPDGIWNALIDLNDGGLAVIDFGKCLTPCFAVILGDDGVMRGLRITGRWS